MQRLLEVEGSVSPRFRFLPKVYSSSNKRTVNRKRSEVLHKVIGTVIVERKKIIVQMKKDRPNI